MPPRTVRLVAALVALAGLSLALRSAPFQLDDAFITYRYAENFVARGEIAFNPGERWVEGFTSPLWFLLLAAGAALLGAAQLPALGLAAGVAAWGAMLLLVWRLASASEDGAARGRSLPPLALAAASPDLAFYAVAGMEQLLLLDALLAVLAAALGRLPFGCGVAAAALATWVRPEAAALPLLLALSALVRGGAGALRSRRLWTLAAAAVAGAALLLALRVALFDALLPNTYFAKAPSLAAGLRYALQSLASPATGALAALGVAGAVVGRREHRAWAALALGWIALAIAEGGDWMPHARFLLPALAGSALAAGGLVAERGAHRARPGVSPPLRWPAAAALGLTLALSVLQGQMTAWRVGRTEARWRAQLVPLLDWIEASGARSIGLVDIGRIGFHSRLEVFDFGGLVDPLVARSPGGLLEKRFDLGYLFAARRPDLILVRFRRPPSGFDGGAPRFASGDAGSPVEARILSDPRRALGYRPRSLYLPGWTPDRYQDRYGAVLLFLAREFRPDPRSDALLPPAGPSGVSIVVVPDPLAGSAPPAPAG